MPATEPSRTSAPLAVGAAGRGAYALALGRLCGRRRPRAPRHRRMLSRLVRLGGPRRRRDQLGIARPPGQTAPLRPVIALHGKGSSAADRDGGGCRTVPGAGGANWVCRRSRSSPSTAAERLLAQARVRRGLRRDGARRAHPDAGRAEPRHVARRLSRLVDGRLRRHAAGLAARARPRTAAICAVSPALWTSAGAAAPGAFDGADDYAANSVWGLPALGVDSAADRLRRRRSVLLGDAAVHRPAAQPARRAASPPAGTTPRSGRSQLTRRADAGWRRC